MERQNGQKVQKTTAHVSQRQAQSVRSPSAVHPFLELQRSIGNQAVQRLINSPYIQTKLQVSTPGDPFEREADHVADTVMRMPDPIVNKTHQPSIQTKTVASQITPLIHREIAQAPEDEEEKTVAVNPFLQRVPLAVRDDDEDEEKIARKVETNAPEEEKEKIIAPKKSGELLQRQASDGVDDETVSFDAPIQRQMKEEEEEEGKLFRQLAPTPVEPAVLQRSTQSERAVSRASVIPVQRLCAKCEDNADRSIQRQAEPIGEDEETIEAQPYPSSLPLQPFRTPSAGSHSTASSSVEGHIASSRGTGAPLPHSSAAFFEPRFGVDLSSVRVHNDSSANNVARQLRAQAFTTGSDIYFATGLYQPETAQGRRLLAHELTHVLQQNPGRMVQRLPANRPFVIQRDPGDEVEPLNIGEDEDIPVPEVKDDESELTEEEMGPAYVPGEEEEIEIPDFDIGDKGDCPQLLPEKLIEEESAGGEAGSAGDVYGRLLQIAAVGGGLSTGIGGLVGGLASALGIEISGLAGRAALAAWRKLPVAIRAFAINQAIDLALSGTEFFPVALLFSGNAVMRWMRAGLIGFLKRLKREDDESKVMLFEKYLEIIFGQNESFTLGYLKGLLWGFFVDGLVGIIQMVMDLVCLVLKIPQFVEALKTFFGAFPEEMEKLGQSIVDLAAAIELAVANAADEVMQIVRDPKRIVGLIESLIKAGEVSSERMGDTIADKLIEFSKKPSGAMGIAVGRATGAVLFEVVLAVLTSGGGAAVTTVKVGVRIVVKMLAKIGRAVWHILHFIKPFLKIFTGFLSSCRKFLTKLVRLVADKLKSAIHAFEEFIEKILKRCRPGSLKCKVPKKRSRKARILAQIKAVEAQIKILLRLPWLSRGTVTGPGGSIMTTHPFIANVTKAERKKVNKAGGRYGDHHTGKRSPGTKSKNWIPDHQPVTELVGMARRSSVLRRMMITARMPTTLASQRLYPHALLSARIQGGTVTAIALKLGKLARLKRKIR